MLKFEQLPCLIKPWSKKTKWSFLANEYLCKFLTGFLIIFLLTVFLPLTGFATGTEITYPSIPAGAATPTATTSFPAYVKYLVGFAMGISGFIAFGVMVWGGILYLTSAGDINQVGEAKRKIFGALLGLIIILGSYVILATINPQLTGMSLQKVEPTSGIYFKKEIGTDCSKKPEDCYYVADDTQEIKLPDNLDVTTVEFISPTSSLLAVYVYNDKDFKGKEEMVYPIHMVSPIPGNYGTLDVDMVSPKSIYFLWKRPGVYLCPTTTTTPVWGINICNQRPLWTNSSISDLTKYPYGDGTYNDQIKSIQIIEPPNGYYSLILFEDIKWTSSSKGCPFVLIPPDNKIDDLNKCICMGDAGFLGTTDSFKDDCIDNLRGWWGHNCPPIGQDTLSSIIVSYIDWGRQISGKVTFYDTTECPGEGASTLEQSASTTLFLDGDLGDDWNDKIRSFMISGTAGVALASDKYLKGRCRYFTRQGGEGYKVDSRGCITRLPTDICNPFWPWSCPSSFIILPLPE